MVTVQQDIKQYVIPDSYPNQMVFVKRHVRENELSKLNGLREDLQNVKVSPHTKAKPHSFKTQIQSNFIVYIE